MLRTRITKAAAVASLVVAASVAAPAVVFLSEADTSSSVVADAGWQVAPADAGWQAVPADAGWQ
ncbi:hypothetical protein ACF09K_05290 [Streptomyces sp. NPDC014882]|uniref:hypothetical protein n=1 Tax=Streptomyces sp. NPDC014882 TaxID=3364927 RepID=UPI0036F7D363